MGLNWLLGKAFIREVTESPPLQISGDRCPIQKDQQVQRH